MVVVHFNINVPAGGPCAVVLKVDRLGHSVIGTSVCIRVALGWLCRWLCDPRTRLPPTLKLLDIHKVVANAHGSFCRTPAL